MNTMLTAAVTMGLAVTTVALWTARVTSTARGRSGLASLLAAIEATVFVTVVARLMGDLDDPVQPLAYAGGVAAGTMSALRMLRLLEPSVVKVDGVVPGDAGELLLALHEDAWPTTTTVVRGLGGPATTVSVTATADRLHDLYATIDNSQTTAFWTETELRSVPEAAVPAGFVQTALPGPRRLLARPGRSAQRRQRASTGRHGRGMDLGERIDHLTTTGRPTP